MNINVIMNRTKTRRFLTADWRYLAMLNYEVDPVLLYPYVPRGTELDEWNGRTYVSIVGFLFLNTRLFGVARLPWHTNFEEVNLRFYVRRRGPEGWRRGVVFIKELVPRWAIATVARVVYNENYQALPMRHAVVTHPDGRLSVAYGWYYQNRWQGIHLQTEGDPQPLIPGSEEEFIAEHYWGYAAQRDGSTVEYRVEHPPWRVWQVADWMVDYEVAALYGRHFADSLKNEPRSAFVADGSAVTVRQGLRLAE